MVPVGLESLWSSCILLLWELKILFDCNKTLYIMAHCTNYGACWTVATCSGQTPLAGVLLEWNTKQIKVCLPLRPFGAHSLLHGPFMDLKLPARSISASMGSAHLDDVLLCYQDHILGRRTCCGGCLFETNNEIPVVLSDTADWAVFHCCVNENI